MRSSIDAVNQWARERGIIPLATPVYQFLKTVSEVGELGDSIAKLDRDGIKDGIGDVAVTLISLSSLYGWDFEDCLKHAYNQIKDRRGKTTIQGVFVKDSSV